LPDLGPVRVQRSGQIGPLVELVRGHRRYPEAFASVVLEAPFAATIAAALDRDTVTGTEKNAQAGVFPLQRMGADGERSDLWQLWASRADQAALTAGFPARIAAKIVDALGELQDNVFRHSEAARTGLVAFARGRARSKSSSATTASACLRACIRMATMRASRTPAWP
jgi:hypothetical protein